MIWRHIILVTLVALPLANLQAPESNDSHFIATSEWQEIKPGQKVPSGLHYRMNLQTGYKEAKILVEEENEKTSLLQVETSEQVDEIVNTDVEMEAARKRLQDALKNIPSENSYDLTEERLKEIAKKYKSYKEIKEDLKELELNVQTEAEMLKNLIERYHKLPITDSSNQEKLAILEDLEYLSHSIDNALLLVSMKGLEDIIVPNLNNSDINLRVMTLKTLGAVLQNNPEAKAYATEKTNIGNYLINILSKYINGNQLSTGLFAYGTLMRNNRKVSPELFKKGMTVLIDIIANDKSDISLPMKTKALVLLDDLTSSDEFKDQDLTKMLDNSRVCRQLEGYFSLNRNGFISDVDSADKAINALVRLKNKCLHAWSESPMFRHTLLVLLNHSKSQLTSSDEDVRFLHSEIVPLLDELKIFLYKDLKISEDDLSLKYDNKINDEL